MLYFERHGRSAGPRPPLAVELRGRGRTDAGAGPVDVLGFRNGGYLGELAAADGDPGPLERTLPFLADFLGT